MRVLLFLLCAFPVVCLSAETTSFDLNAFTASERKVDVYAGQFIDLGDFKKANLMLEKAVKIYPKNDHILSLYGKSLFESGSQDKAETYFMQALKLNSRNEVAKSYIDKIREIRATIHSESSQEWALIIKDKIGDLIVFVLSIWLGTSLNSIWKSLFRKHRWNEAQERFQKRKYQDIVRILESHVREMDQDEIDRCLCFMLDSSHSMDDLIAIVKKYIIRNEDFLVIERSLKLLDEARIEKEG